MKRILVIILFIPFIINAQNISVSSFKQLPNDLDARVNYPIKDQNGNNCALIKMVTTQTGFTFEGDMNGITKTEHKTGEYWIYVPYGSKKITVKHNNLGVLRNYIYPIPIKEATTYEMQLVSANVKMVIETKEIPMQWLVISSEPTGADVYLNDKYVGQTPYQKKKEVGTYSYRIEKSMYHNTAGTIALTTDEKSTTNIILKPNFGFAEISTKPENGASIEIDGVPQNNKTPFTTEALKSGKHKLTVKKPMFEPKTINFEIFDNQITDLNIELNPLFATVNIATDPKANIYIDDEKKGFGTYKGRLMPGVHTIEAKLDKHSTDRKQFEFVSGQNQELSLHPMPKTGSIDVITNPIGALVYINDKESGLTPTTIENLLVGDYSISLRKHDYPILTKTISITENQKIIINETLSAGITITINSKPEGASVFIDDSFVGTAPYRGLHAFGTHRLKLINGQKVVEEKIVIANSNATIWEFDVSEDEGTIVNGILLDTRDNEEYKIIEIGNQVWMNQNLRYASGKYITDNAKWVDLEFNDTDAAYCWYNNFTTNKEYGALYNYAAAKYACPSGWHLPTKQEFEIFLKNIGDEKSAFDYLTEDRVNNASALGGYRGFYEGRFYDKWHIGGFWSCSSSSPAYMWIFFVNRGTQKASIGKNLRSMGFSVRCIKD